MWWGLSGKWQDVVWSSVISATAQTCLRHLDLQFSQAFVSEVTLHIQAFNIFYGRYNILYSLLNFQKSVFNQFTVGFTVKAKLVKYVKKSGQKCNEVMMSGNEDLF